MAAGLLTLWLAVVAPLLAQLEKAAAELTAKEGQLVAKDAELEDRAAQLSAAEAQLKEKDAEIQRERPPLGLAGGHQSGGGQAAVRPHAGGDQSGSGGGEGGVSGGGRGRRRDAGGRRGDRAREDLKITVDTTISGGGVIRGQRVVVKGCVLTVRDLFECVGISWRL